MSQRTISVEPAPSTEPVPVVVARSAAAPTGRATNGHGPLPDVRVEMGGLGAVQADKVVVSAGAIGAARADRVSVDVGAIGVVAADRARLTAGASNLVLAREATLEQAIVQTVTAGRVTLGRGSVAGIVIAGRVDGPGRPIIDGRAGLITGAVLALAWFLLRRLR